MLQTGINTVILSAAAAVAGKLDDPCSHRSKLIFFRSFVLLSGQQIRIKPYHFKLILRTVHFPILSGGESSLCPQCTGVSGPINKIETYSHFWKQVPGSRIFQLAKPKSTILLKTLSLCLSIRHAAVQDSWHKTHDAPECFQFLHH